MALIIHKEKSKYFPTISGPINGIFCTYSKRPQIWHLSDSGQLNVPVTTSVPWPRAAAPGRHFPKNQPWESLDRLWGPGEKGAQGGDTALSNSPSGHQTGKGNFCLKKKLMVCSNTPHSLPSLTGKEGGISLSAAQRDPGSTSITAQTRGKHFPAFLGTSVEVITINEAFLL